MSITSSDISQAAIAAAIELGADGMGLDGLIGYLRSQAKANPQEFFALLAALAPYVKYPTRLTIDVPRLIQKGGKVMPGSVNCTRDHDMRIPLKWSDDVGVVAAPATGTTAVASDTTVITAIDVAADDGSIVLRTGADGTCTVTVTNGTMTDSITVTVSEPVASVLNVDAADATQVAKGAAA